jgi:hypothetical protein
MLPAVRLPRMADFALWVTACETALWPAGTFLGAYEANRRAAIETVTRPTPWPPGFRDIMAAQHGRATHRILTGHRGTRAGGLPDRLRAAQSNLYVFLAEPSQFTQNAL